MQSVEKFGVKWQKKTAKTNTLYTIQDESLYNDCKKWYMLVQDENGQTIYLAYHNHPTKGQIDFRASNYSKKPLYTDKNINEFLYYDEELEQKENYYTIFQNKILYAVPEQRIDIIEQIDSNMMQYVDDTSAWLFSWNPEKWNWTSFEDDIQNLKQGLTVEEKYSCVSKKPKIGDRAFIIKLGQKEPKGIVASGYISKESFIDTAEHRTDEKEINKVKIKFDSIINYNENKILPQNKLKEIFPNQEWSPQSSGIKIKDEYKEDLEDLWGQYNIQYDDEIDFELLVNWAENYFGKKYSSKDVDTKIKGQKTYREFKKLGKYVLKRFPEYQFSKCSKWQNSGYLQKNLWILFKKKDYKTRPFSISIFLTKEDDNKAKLDIHTDLEDKKAKGNDYKLLGRTLDVPIETDLSWRWYGSVAFDTSEKAKQSLSGGESKKVLIAKNINRPYKKSETARIINELQSGFKTLIPCYENIFKNEDNKTMTENIPLNQILYGPPGTGKTYSVKEYINKILGNNPGLKKNDETQKYKNVVKDMYWYSVIALSMFENGKDNKYKVADIQKQRLLQMFAQTKVNKNINSTLWRELQIHTNPNSDNVHYGNQKMPYLFDKTEDSSWFLTQEGKTFVEQNLSDKLELLNAKDGTNTIEDYYRFITFHQSYSYEEFVEGIKPVINDDEDEASISYEYNTGIFKEICQRANSDPDNNYLLVIDEINRGNISKIFGELITLIEPDKRVTPNKALNFENTNTDGTQLLVTLPYTKTKFGVPSNLYILGTMNTSDRSIASIDIALRRRFVFKEMMPKPELVADFGVGFKDIFESLNDKIKILLDRDHQIGHSYFINTKYNDEKGNNNPDTLKNIWFTEILPLLNEYFYCDWEKLKLIVPGFINKKDVPETLQQECDEDSFYEFKTPDEIENFETALKQEKFA